MSAIIIRHRRTFLNWIVVGLANFCCIVCQNIALLLVISYYLAFSMHLLLHLNARVCVYNTASVKYITVAYLPLCYYLRIIWWKWTWELLSIISVWLASMWRNWCKYFLRTLPWKSAIVHGSGSTWTKWLWWVSVSWKKFQEATFCKIIFFPCIVWTYMTFFHVQF